MSEELDDNKERLLIMAFGAAAVAIALVFICLRDILEEYVVMSIPSYVMLAVLGVLICAWLLNYFLTIPTNRRNIRKLNKMGYQCAMDEGRIAFRRNDYNWSIKTYDIKKRYRRIVFTIGFTNQEEFVKDHALANRIFCLVGSRNRFTVLTWNGMDAYACDFHTVFTSTRDIEREFNVAMSAMDETLSELSYAYQQLSSQMPAKSDHKIGFQVGENNPTPEETSSEVRAQKEQ